MMPTKPGPQGCNLGITPEKFRPPVQDEERLLSDRVADAVSQIGNFGRELARVMDWARTAHKRLMQLWRRTEDLEQKVKDLETQLERLTYERQPEPRVGEGAGDPPGPDERPDRAELRPQPDGPG